MPSCGVIWLGQIHTMLCSVPALFFDWRQFNAWLERFVARAREHGRML